jgi:hypothetical protein
MTPRAVEGRHAMYAGWVAGRAMKAGLDVIPILTDDGRYTDHFGVVLPEARGPAIRVYVIVPEPPDDWAMGA